MLTISKKSNKCYRILLNTIPAIFKTFKVSIVVVSGFDSDNLEKALTNKARRPCTSKREQLNIKRWQLNLEKLPEVTVLKEIHTTHQICDQQAVIAERDE